MERLLQLMSRRWGFKNLGIYANRPVRNPQAKGALSTHATGWALDAGHSDPKVLEEAFLWLVQYSKELRLSENHQYSFGKFGRGYRCSRGEGMKGVKVFTKTDNAGTPGGAWLHVEVSNDWDSAEEFEKMWRSLPKP